MNTWERTREVANWLNLSTVSGLVLAATTGCGIERGARGIIYARDYTPALPPAQAFTMGNVVFFRPSLGSPALHPQLLSHEETHCTQYALCLGLPFLPLYFAAAGYSWLRTSDPASRNIFERAAGLRAGGYRERPIRRLLPVLAAGLRREIRRAPAPAPTMKGTAA